MVFVVVVVDRGRRLVLNTVIGGGVKVVFALANGLESSDVRDDTVNCDCLGWKSCEERVSRSRGVGFRGRERHSRC